MGAQKTAFTPGPWVLVPATEHHGPYIAADRGGDVCDCYCMTEPGLASTRNGGPSRPVNFQGEEAHANARLIAAAPDLFAQLARVTDHLEVWARDHSDERTSETDAAIYCARAVLARAKGETP